jgi:hypothetical protein
MNNHAHVTVTNRKVGLAVIFPYTSPSKHPELPTTSPRVGRQVYRDPGGNPILDPNNNTSDPKIPVLYYVPAYQVVVNGGSRYRAIRFALQNWGTAWPADCRCDAGISHKVELRPSWDPNYETVTLVGPPGGWRLFPDAPPDSRYYGYLIHNVPDQRNLNNPQLAGSFGCVEILDGQWNAFLLDIQRVTGKSKEQLGRERGLRVSFEAATFPGATLSRQAQRFARHISLDNMLNDPRWGGGRYRPDHR